jgi:hypothetical protein
MAQGNAGVLFKIPSYFIFHFLQPYIVSTNNSKNKSQNKESI